MNKLIIAAAAACLSFPGIAIAGTYGPPEPKPFVYPYHFTVEADETLEQAQAKVEAKRRCARRWAVAGIVAGTAADIATTQWNQSSGYREVNPIYGKHASVKEQLIFHGISGAFTYWRIDRQARKYPDRACKDAKIIAGVSMLPGVINLGVRIVM